jgi:hypothetical protein
MVAEWELLVGVAGLSDREVDIFWDALVALARPVVAWSGALRTDCLSPTHREVGSDPC